MPPSIDTVLFDAFNTLWHPARAVADMWADVLKKFGAVRTAKEIISAVAEHQTWMEPRALCFETSGHPVDDETIEALWTEFDGRVLPSLGVHVSDEAVVSNAFPIFSDFNALYDDTVEVLASVRRMGYRMAIVSNGVYQRRAAARLGVAEYFDSIIGSWHVGFMNPDPEISTWHWGNWASRRNRRSWLAIGGITTWKAPGRWECARYTLDAERLSTNLGTKYRPSTG